MSYSSALCHCWFNLPPQCCQDNTVHKVDTDLVFQGWG